ncbi:MULTISPECIES: L-glyceraldehyde 3-phosphate reductase [Spirosoma]|uniref:L-glyceraldehyde 3-phosphate reductase n=1 Tax=Spirosoma sordidisoli TaxID=2502893 RepID=A0A4Q2UDA3_9BACT|nr:MULTISPECIES: L-glyceraldehyde 3-phosphate reductase [Spirosoma]RYC67153.1 L-glyceraldehyde 3-phosphate reductase [Spirosoma sordidisoli]
MRFQPAPTRYQSMTYRRCGHSGLLLPAISLGLWQNFGHVDSLENSRQMVQRAFDLGITHFDLANNYGPPPGSAEENFGHILYHDLPGYRDELVISTKAGYGMWNGPYGDGGSRKYLIASLNQSLKRMHLEYVDIFYHHRPDPNTPLEETMSALDQIVREGKALYIGLSNYKPAETKKAIDILNQLGTPCLIHQPRYSMLDRWAEEGLLDVLEQEGVGCIPFSPLAQGLLTDKYLSGVPAHSRAARNGSLPEHKLTPEILELIGQLNELAQQRGQTLAQMAIAWLLKDERVTSVLIGASRPEQITDSVQALAHVAFTNDELAVINGLLTVA